jgi:serpin B
LVDKGDNPVISPSCLYRTLALLARMTGGATRSEIEGVLGGTRSMQAAVDAIERVGERSKPDRDVLWQGDGFCYSVGSSVWIDEKLELNPHFCANVQRTASCDVERVGMGTAEVSKTMGSWLERNTGGHFADGPETTKDTALVVIGAMYLKDAWRDEFCLDDEPHPFMCADGTARNIDFMSSQGEYQLFERNGALAVRKPLVSGCSVVLAVPARSVALHDYVASAAAWNDITTLVNRRDGWFTQDCKLFMPRFRLSSDGLDIQGIMCELGVSSLFGLGADFGPTTPESVFVDSAHQSTCLDVDEKGIEGASYVVFSAVTGYIERPKPRMVVLDRPFAVAVFSPENVPLFVGLVTDPGR